MSLTVGGVDRTYYLVMPPGAKAHLPVVVALHGANEDLETFQLETKLDNEAASARFLLVYPMAISGAWNASDCCVDPAAPGPDDVSFIRQLIDGLVSTGQVDPTRVYVTGFSAGGLMVYRLACELSDHVTAFAAVSGASVMDSCNPSRPVSMLEIHGTADKFVPLEGGTYGILNYRSASSTLGRWAQFDGCSATPAVSSSGITQTTAWTHCQNGTSVVLDTVKGLGHAWYSPEMFGPDATKMVWDFFSHASTA